MSRTLSTPRRNSLEAPYSGDVDLLFLTLSHPDMRVPICICNDVVNFVFNGATYLGLSAEILLVSDSDSPPKSKVRIHNVRGQVGKFLQSLTLTPRIKIEVCCDADWNADLIATGETDLFGNPVLARYPIAVPDVDVSADWLRLKNASGDAMSVSGDICSFDMTGEPWPAIRTTQDRLPGLYR